MTNIRDTGTVTAFFVRKGYGYIKPDNHSEDVFVHYKALAGDGFQCLAVGEQVAFEASPGEKGFTATKVWSPVERLAGHIESWDQNRGIGSVETQEQASVSLHHSAVLTSPGQRAHFKQGDEVEFETEIVDGRTRAVRVKKLDPRLPLYRFAQMPQVDRWTSELAHLAEPENWNHYGESQEDSDRPILVSYLERTFQRLQEQDEEEGAKLIREDANGDKRLCCFNTGLVNPFQEEIFALFEENHNPQLSPWYFRGFHASSSRPLEAVFGANLPDVARYFQHISELYFDPDLELVIDARHIVDDNVSRFPEPFRSNPYLAHQIVESQIERVRKRARRNYKTAIPQYYNGSIQLLLPLQLSQQGQTDLALVISREGDHYRGSTVLPLPWAYKNARLITKPDPDWLVPI